MSRPQTHLSEIAQAFGSGAPSDGVWPASITPGGDYYNTPDGRFVRVTRVLSVLGTKTEGLIKWAANEERKAVLEAATQVFADHLVSKRDAYSNFPEQVEAMLGKARQHQKQIAKAADIGTAAHKMVSNFLEGLGRPEVVGATAESIMAFRAWLDWWTGSGLKVVRVEQSVWDKDLGYAGTIDAVVECPKRGLGVIDTKTSKSIYDQHHIQVAAYMSAAKRWGDVRWGQIVRLPKSMTDPSFEVVDLGNMYDRTMSQDELMDCFRSCLTLWNRLCKKA